MATPYRLLGENIRTLRKREGLSQEKLAEKSKLTPNFISMIERGAAHPSIDSMIEISAALNVDLADFFLEQKEKSPAEASRELKRLVDKAPAEAPLLLALYRTIRNLPIA
ncbi:MAG: helix-turn-helix transcriptional regulator [Candidatus Omnitrophica bacterium]|nr:helix-turn-helix transcriptional regulator [Candidatus Omnitrophota bacterium]